MNDRRAPSIDGPRSTYAACTIRNRTKLVRDGSWTQDGLIALGWVTLSVEHNDRALMLAPDWMEA